MMMIKLGCLAFSVAFLMSLGSASNARQSLDAVPDGPFETIHLMAVEPTQEAALKSAIKDFNDQFRAQGCSTCSYRVFRMYVGSQSPYNVMISADWPSRSEYLRIHDSAASGTMYANHPVFAALEAKQLYGRFVEMK